MKKLLCLSVLLSAFLSLTAQEKRETIEGNGKPSTKNYTVSSFNELKVSGVFDLQLSQSGSEAVRLEADENLLEYVTVKNEGSKLVIDMDKIRNKNFNSKGKLKLFIDFKKLNTIESSIVGNMTGKSTLKFDNLELSNKGVGNVDLDLNASKMNLRNTGVGSITLDGKAESADIHNNGVGSIKAGNFIVQTVNIQNNGIGSAEVNASKDVKVTSSGMGSVKNKGAAPMPKRKRTMTI
jgi:hypothetical protein